MYSTPQFEIPIAVRELAERNINQVRQSYEQVLGLMNKAQDAALKSHGALTKGAIETKARRWSSLRPTSWQT